MSCRTLVGVGLAAGAGVALYAYARQKQRASALPPAPAAGQPTVTDDVNALARVIASEVGRGTPAERAAIGWATRNRAQKRRVSIVRLVCTPWCGPQHEAHATMRPFSSGQAGTREDVHLAAAILAAPQSEDPTGGATSFIEPALQDQLTAAGKLGYRLTYAEVRAKWIAEGQLPLGRVGRFELWRA